MVLDQDATASMPSSTLRAPTESTRANDLARRLANTSELSLLLDYDGTLVSFAATPELATPDRSLLQLLGHLVLRRGAQVEIVSGRDPMTLAQWFGDLPIGLRAEHGAWRRALGEKSWSAAVSVDARAVGLAAERLGALTSRLGGWVERKCTGAAWHYRGVDVETASVDGIARSIESQLGPIGFSVLRGACVVEAKARGIDKGIAVRDNLAASPTATIVAIGDDVTDEDMFRALPLPHVGIVVGDGGRATAASHRFSGVTDVRGFLASLVSSFE